MNQKILKFLADYSYKEHDINRLLVTTFIAINNISSLKNVLIKTLLISENDVEEYKEFKKFQTLFGKDFTIEDLLRLFEFVISPSDKEVNGAVYTPNYIREFIVKSVFDQATEQSRTVSTLKIADIACGCGGFFVNVAEQLRLSTGKSYFDIYNDNIFGVDIQAYSITRTKIFLSLYAIRNGEDRKHFSFNLFQGNSLSFKWQETFDSKFNGFDIIIGNPPYVGASKIDNISKSLLKNWPVASSGKADLYIPFFQIALDNLKDFGILGYITVNTFQKSLNARALRHYFSEKKYEMRLIDFGGEQIFKGRTTYTCICIIEKKPSNIIYYSKSASKNLLNLKAESFLSIEYGELDNYEGWNILNIEKIRLIKKISNIGHRLGDSFEIRNGFATLKNKVYVFTPLSEDNEYYTLIMDSKEYKIEKGICRNVIKPNTLRSEDQISINMEKLIFPYEERQSGVDIFGQIKSELKLISETNFKDKFPNAYKYLTNYKAELSKRDNGEKEYQQWFAFGRNQALTLKGNKLLLPYITDSPCFVFCDDYDLLFYNGYAILSDDILQLRILQKILMSSIFWFYIVNTSRPYSGKYFSVAKNYIKGFGICNLSDKDRDYLNNTTDPQLIDKFLCKKYNISYSKLRKYLSN